MDLHYVGDRDPGRRAGNFRRRIAIILIFIGLFAFFAVLFRLA